MDSLRGIYVSQTSLRRIQSGEEVLSFSAQSAYVLLLQIKQIDSSTIDALLGRCDGAQQYVDKFDSLSRYAYFQDYQRQDSGYFTFDGVTFYRPISYYSDSETRANIKLRILPTPSFTAANKAFQLMPFKNPVFDSVYNQVIKPALKSIGIEIYRADDFADNDIISETIIGQIRSAEFIIVEATLANKNVFFELGYAASLNKEIITLLQAGNTFDFFDRGHIRYIEYDPSNPQALTSRLVETIETIRTRHRS